MKVRQPESWVIYRKVVGGEVTGPTGVCEQAEWEAMERDEPGGTFVIQSGIADEGVAERLARGASGNPVARVWREMERRHVGRPGSPVTQQEAQNGTEGA